jgi:hypothetical protein
MRKWHKKLHKVRDDLCFAAGSPSEELSLQALTDCIQTGEYMHVYNAIIILKEILPMFPLAKVAPEFGPSVNHAMEQFIAKEKRGDLKILARAYAASLQKREPFWAPPKNVVAKVPSNGMSCRIAN